MNSNKFLRRVVPAALPTDPPRSATRAFKPAPLPTAQNPYVQIAKRKAAGEQRLAAVNRAVAAQVAATPLKMAQKRRSR